MNSHLNNELYSNAMEAAQLEKLNEQFKNTFDKAFDDLLEQKVAEDPPDYDWITRLYAELRDRLAKLLKTGSSMRVEIEEKMDIELFTQMLKENAFTGEHMYALVNYIFDACDKLQSPGRDENSALKRKELIDFMNGGECTFAKFVPLFIRNANECIDFIYQDLHEFLKQLSEADQNKIIGKGSTNSTVK